VAVFQKYKKYERFGNWICFILGWPLVSRFLPLLILTTDRDPESETFLLYSGMCYFMMSETELSRLCTRVSEMQMYE
jgi:hypothetical protein